MVTAKQQVIAHASTIFPAKVARFIPLSFHDLRNRIRHGLTYDGVLVIGGILQRTQGRLGFGPEHSKRIGSLGAKTRRVMFQSTGQQRQDAGDDPVIVGIDAYKRQCTTGGVVTIRRLQFFGQPFGHPAAIRSPVEAGGAPTP